MMIIDECEVLFGSATDNDVRGSIHNLFLTEIEKIQKSDKDIFLICATNRPALIDEVILSRMRIKIHVPLPSNRTKIDYISKSLKNKDLSFQESDVSSVVSKQLEHHSFREVDTILEDIVKSSIENNLEPATHFKIQNHDNGQYFIPCLCPGCDGSVKSTHSKLPRDAIKLPMITQSDFSKAISGVLPSNTDKLIKDNYKFEKGELNRNVKVPLSSNQNRSSRTVAPKRGCLWVILIFTIILIVTILIILYELKSNKII